MLGELRNEAKRGTSQSTVSEAGKHPIPHAASILHAIALVFFLRDLNG